MLADKDFVRNIVYGLADMRGSIYTRRSWCDRNKRDKSLRYLTFKFYDSVEADRVAAKLQTELATAGYTNVVRRTSVNEIAREHAEYVRLVAKI